MNNTMEGVIPQETKDAIVAEAASKETLQEVVDTSNALVEKHYEDNKMKQLRNEIATSVKEHKEDHLLPEDITEAREILTDFYAVKEKYKITDDETITIIGTRFGASEYGFSSKDAQKKPWFRENKKAVELSIVATMAEYFGLDLHEPKTVNEIISFIKHRAGLEDLKIAA